MSITHPWQVGIALTFGPAVSESFGEPVSADAVQTPVFLVKSETRAKVSPWVDSDPSAIFEEPSTIGSLDTWTARD